MKKYIKSFIAVLLCLLMIGSISAVAITPSYAPYLAYEYNTFDESVAAPIGYLPDGTVSGQDLHFQVDISSFTDIAIDDHSPDYTSLYILDGKLGNVYRTDTSLNVKCVFDDIKSKNGSKVDLKGATMLATDFSSSLVYVYKDGVIYIINSLSKLVGTIDAPNVVTMATYGETSLTGEGYDTYLCVVTADKQDGISVYNGNTGEFLGFSTIGSRITDLCFTVSSNSFVAVDAQENSILTLDAFGISNGELNAQVLPTSVDLSNATAITPDSFGFECFVSTNKAIYRIDLMTGDVVLEMDGSSVPKNISKPSLNFRGLCYNSNNDLILGVANSSDPQITSFNIEGGFIETVDTLTVSLLNPTDIYYNNKDYVYILDSGNSRVIKLNKELTEIVDIFSNFYSDELGYVDFYGAKGFAIDADENIYIADTEKMRVLKADKDGNIKLVITRPDDQLVDTEAPFSVVKVLLDRKNQIYVICNTINLGAFVFNQDGEFKNFFASNNVKATVDVVLDFFRKKFLTREQMKGIKKTTPIELANFDVDSEGFVYTVTETDNSKTNTDFTEMLRKLNYQGDNVFSLNGNSKGFGDFEWDRQDTITNTSFGDVDVDSSGYINLIDLGRGKVFQYTDEGNLVTVFGGYSLTSSEQVGKFTSPVAIESVDKKILILDEEQNNITVFKPTQYTESLRTAYNLMDSSDYESSRAAWSKVLEFNTNSQYPYYGMGRSYEIEGDYEQAMYYFKIANAKEEYSKAYKEYRKDLISDNIGLIVLALIVVLAAVIIISKILKRKMVAKHGEAYSPLETKGGLPIYVLMHPVDGFEQFRTRNMQSIPIAIGLVVTYFLVKVFEFFCTGFAFNNNRSVDYDMLATIIATIGLYVLFVIANWAVCTLANGKGRMREIICVTAYALIPVMLTTFIKVALTNFMALDEAAFVSIISTIGLLWSAVILLLGLYTIHQYSFLGTIGSVLLTVLGMAIMGLLLVLFFTLLQQCYSFIFSVISELRLR